MEKTLSLADKKKIFLESSGNNLEPRSLTREELIQEIARRKRTVENFKQYVEMAEKMVAEAEIEASSRPSGDSYSPGIYFDNTPVASGCFTYSPVWVAREAELIIVDHKGYPWAYFGGGKNYGWHRYGITMNNTSERVWERVGDL